MPWEHNVAGSIPVFPTIFYLKNNQNCVNYNMITALLLIGLLIGLGVLAFGVAIGVIALILKIVFFGFLIGGIIFLVKMFGNSDGQMFP